MNPTTSHEDASSKHSSQYLDSKTDSGPGATHLEMDDIARAPELLMDKEAALGLGEDEPKKHVLTKRQDLLLFSACCFSLFQAGWNDASTGPLIPSLQAHYNIRYIIMSIVFIIASVGFFLGAMCNVWLTHRFGLGWVVFIGGALQILSFSLICWGPPYAVFAIAQFSNGFGTSIQDAQANTLVNFLHNSDMKMAWVHALYGLGATCSPLFSTQFVIHVPKFYYYYFCSLGLAIANCVYCVCVYRFRTIDQLLGPTTTAEKEAAGISDSDDEKKEKEDSGETLRFMMKKPITWMIAGFLLAYVGLEVTIGGWIVDYLREVRGADANAGYVATGFWGGLTVGRAVLVPVNRKLGTALAIHVYLACCIGLHFVVWFVPSYIANAVTASLVGVFLGPIYPLIMNACAVVFPKRIVGASIGFVASFGAAGGAIFPFMTGALSDKFTVRAMMPCILVLYGICTACWVPVAIIYRRFQKAGPPAS